MNSFPPKRQLNVWIVNPYGWLPGEGWRDYRSAPLAKALAARGHMVTWWISDIEHRSRSRRTPSQAALPFGVTLEMIESREYRKNISIGRIRYERSFAAGFARRSKMLPPPDLVVLAEPSLFFAGPVVDYATSRGIPFILDGIDLWPEMFQVVLPRSLRRLEAALFAPFYRHRDRIVKQATAVVAVTADYLERLTRRVKPALSEVVYLGVDRLNFLTPQIDRNATAPLEAIYAGNLGDAYDMPVLLMAIERLANAGRPVRFTLIGAGPWEEQAAALAARFPAHVRFLGRMSPTALPAMYAQAQVGLATYSSGSTVSMPTKLFDYLAAGLATIGSPSGEAVALLRQGAGTPYQAGSVNDLIAALNVYIDDRTKLADARMFAYKQAARFDQDAQYERFVSVIEAAVDSRAGAASDKPVD